MKVRLQAPPVEGKANARLAGFLAGAWRIPRPDIGIIAGQTGRDTRLRLARPADELHKTLLSTGGT